MLYVNKFFLFLFLLFCYFYFYLPGSLIRKCVKYSEMRRAFIKIYFFIELEQKWSNYLISLSFETIFVFYRVTEALNKLSDCGKALFRAEFTPHKDFKDYINCRHQFPGSQYLCVYCRTVRWLPLLPWKVWAPVQHSKNQV